MNTIQDYAIFCTHFSRIFRQLVLFFWDDWKKIEEIYLLTLINGAIDFFNYIAFLSILPGLLKPTFSSFVYTQHKHNTFIFQPPEFDFHAGKRDVNFFKGLLRKCNSSLEFQITECVNLICFRWYTLISLTLSVLFVVFTGFCISVSK